MFLYLLVDCSENHHVNKITFTPMKESPIVPGWNIDVNKGPWTARWNSLVGNVHLFNCHYHFQVTTKYLVYVLKTDLVVSIRTKRV